MESLFLIKSLKEDKIVRKGICKYRSSSRQMSGRTCPNSLDSDYLAETGHIWELAVTGTKSLHLKTKSCDSLDYVEP